MRRSILLSALAAFACAGSVTPFATAASSAVIAQDAKALVASGRAHLAAGRLADARADFERAAAAEPGLATKVWLWRVAVAEGKYGDVLGEISSARRSGEKGPELDYALGFALLAQAEADIASGNAGQAGLMLADAGAKLRKAAEADPERFADAYAPMARAFHLAGEPEQALEAAREAVKKDARSVAAHEVLGSSAVTVGRAKQDADAKAAKALFEEGAQALAKAIELARGAKAHATELARLSVQLGHAHQFAGDAKAADAAYADALALSPDAIDLQQLLGIIARDRLIGVLTRATDEFAKANGERHPGDATMLWWLGWALYDQGKDLAKAEAALLETLEKAPRFVNSWYWLYRVRLGASRWVDAHEALAQHVAADEALLIDTMRRTADEFARVEYLGAKLAEGGRRADAAWISELLARAVPQDDAATVAKHWNNAGVLWRDAGDARGGRGGPGTFPADRRDELFGLYERAWKAYEQAIAHDPENPALLNDAAVVLDYNLERDLEKALDMYRRAEQLAERRLAEDDLSDEDRQLFKVALRDARNNGKKLAKKLEKGGGGG